MNGSEVKQALAQLNAERKESVNLATGLYSSVTKALNEAIQITKASCDHMDADGNLQIENNHCIYCNALIGEKNDD